MWLPQKIEVAAAQVTEAEICKWFNDAATYSKDIPGGEAALADPKRVFNCDEMGFLLDGRMG